MRVIAAVLFFGSMAFGQSMPCSQARPQGTIRFTYQDDSGVTCYDLPASLTPALAAYVQLGPTAQEGPGRGAPKPTFQTPAQAILWQILNRLVPQWIQAQGQAAIQASAAALQAAKGAQ